VRRGWQGSALRSPRTAAAPLLTAAVLLLAGCGGGGESTVVTVGDAGNVPDCRSPADPQLVLMAQAVPTASRLPCVHAIPAGWAFGRFVARDGQARFVLGSDRDGVEAVTVLLEPACDSAGSTPVRSEVAGATRSERVTRVTSGYGGQRYYRFAGGCVTYRFDLEGTTRAEPVAAASQALGFLPREEVARAIDEESDGRLRLDPEPEGGR
jgi:hypothetical protein